MNQQELGRQIAGRLGEGLEGISPAVLQRLGAARDAALRRARGEEVLGNSTTAARSGGPARFTNPRVLAPIAALAFVLLAVLYAQQAPRVPQNTVDNGDVDAEVLSDELPVTAYLDQGFEVWLYHHSPAASDQN